MKKKLLILAMCLFSAISANAASGVALDSGNDDIQIFIDNDSIKYIDEDICTYAVLYKKGEELPKVVYMKSDYKTDRTGVVRVEDFRERKYNPGFYSKHSSAYMKNITDNAIFTSAHEYAFQSHYKVTTQYPEAKQEPVKENIRPVANYIEKDTTQEMAVGLYEAYVEQLKKDIFENWKTSKDTINQTVNLIISVNSDGSYNGYKIYDSTSNEKARRAAVAAVNLTAPFARFPQNENFVNQTVNIPITFEQKRFRKYVK